MRGYYNKTMGPYMRQTMTPIMRAILESPLNIEIEPEDNEIPAGMDRAEAVREAASNLAILCGELLDTLQDNEQNEDTRTPWELRYVLWSAFEATKVRFPGHEQSAASALLFLRLITPTVTMGGKNFQLDLDTKIVMKKRRVTTLVGKIIQYIANCVVPEGMPTEIIEFVKTRIEINKTFISSIAGERPRDGEPCYVFPSGPGEYDAAVKGIASFVIREEALLSYPEADTKNEPQKSIQMEISSAVQDVIDSQSTSPHAGEESPTALSGGMDTRIAVAEEPGYKACCMIS